MAQSRKSEESLRKGLFISVARTKEAQPETGSGARASDSITTPRSITEGESTVARRQRG